ncbi:heat shock protein beta-1-like [Amphibalanus amphitrite]|uniref:heat shock protein beta-1-like n=1 Tax=Amphibalanus amphitrite TaxID=1232801 RepID=UPI001C907DC3|nr:heat shock protein beta-1-like [Amphibalanus amphitrite]
MGRSRCAQLPTREFSPFVKHAMADNMSFWLGPWMGFPLLAELAEPRAVEKPEKPDKFQVSMHLGHYKPDEVVVKVADGTITVRAEHEEKHPDGYSFSRTVRQFTAPEDACIDKLTSQLTPSGHLKLEAPLAQERRSTARTIPIEIEGPREEKKDGPPLRITYDSVGNAANGDCKK